ncbi:MAG TPA: universal stress protein [Candidatus Bathyarchaeia archaeon]|nr:universal stress protein [Candidatus Bathyarchaeia archaeon]
MKPIRKILAPTDLSQFSETGVRYALNLAKDIGAEVTVYHVVNSDELIQYGEEMKEKIASDRAFRLPESFLEKDQLALRRYLKDHFADLIPSVNICEKVELGRTEESIVEEAKKHAADLIVISSHGRTALAYIVKGSVTEKLIRNAPCPVLSIGPESIETMAEGPSAV